MAFNEKELEIIKFGQQNGKTGDEIREAVTRYRTGNPVTVSSTTSPAPEPSFSQRVSSDINNRANQNLAILNESGKDTSLSGTAASGMKLAANTAGGITDVLGEAIRSVPGGKQALDAIGGFASQQFKNLTDALSNTKFFQEAATGLEPGNTLENALSIASSGGEIADTILATKGIATGAQTTLNVARNTATKATNAVGTAVNDARAALGDVSTLPSKAKAWVQQPLKANVQTVLKETPVEQFDDYVNTARKAALNNKNATPLEVVGTRAQSALDQIQRKLGTIGSNKSAIMQSSVGRQPVGNIVVRFRQQLQSAIKTRTSVEGNQRVYNDVLAKAEALGNNPTARQVDQFIDYVQDRIYTGKRDLTVPVTDDIERVLRPLTGQLNDGLKARLPESYRTLNQQYSDLVSTRNELNLKLGAEGEKGGALMKRVFSPSDANTKKLFADVLDITGIDLVNEATLARYLMDILGDARQKSMLEQLNLQITSPTAGGVATRLIDYLVEKANSPEDLIRRARELTVGGAASTVKP